MGLKKISCRHYRVVLIGEIFFSIIPIILRGYSELYGHGLARRWAAEWEGTHTESTEIAL